LVDSSAVFGALLVLIITSTRLSTYVKSCDTLTHEVVRSDHIAVLSDIEVDVCPQQHEPKTFRPLKKVNWNSWREETEDQFKEWLTLKHTEVEVEETYKTFYNILEAAREKVIPEITQGERRRSVPAGRMKKYLSRKST